MRLYNDGSEDFIGAKWRVSDEVLNFCRAECWELYEASRGVLLHTIDATTPAEQESLLHQEICFELDQSK